MKRLFLFGLVTLMVACGGDGGRAVVSRDPFCQRVLPAVDAFMTQARADNPVPDDDRYGGTVVGLARWRRSADPGDGSHQT